MRLRIVFVCLTVAACSSPTVSSTPPTLPNNAVVAGAIATVFAASKLPGSPEVSPIRATILTEMGDWMACLKSSAPDQPRRYAIFFQDNKLINYRIAVVIDNCDKETYAPPRKK